MIFPALFTQSSQSLLPYKDMSYGRYTMVGGCNLCLYMVCVYQTYANEVSSS